MVFNLKIWHNPFKQMHLISPTLQGKLFSPNLNVNYFLSLPRQELRPGYDLSDEKVLSVRTEQRNDIFHFMFFFFFCLLPSLQSVN